MDYFFKTKAKKAGKDQVTIFFFSSVFSGLTPADIYSVKVKNWKHQNNVSILFKVNNKLTGKLRYKFICKNIKQSYFPCLWTRLESEKLYCLDDASF